VTTSQPRTDPSIDICGITALRLDHLRAARTGIAEAVYGPGKTPRQCAEAVRGLLEGPTVGPVLLTRATAEQAAAALTLNLPQCDRRVL